MPYWDIDTGMAALLMLLTADGRGLGALFFGVPRGAARRGPRGASASPPAARIVGVVSLGYRPSRVRSPSRARRRRRPLDEVAPLGPVRSVGR